MRVEDCPVKTALDVIDGKWKPLILFALKNSPMRYGELRRFVEGATQKVLTEQLRQLEASGVLQRTVLETEELHVEYRLSAYGETLRPVLSALAEWGSARQEKLERAEKAESVWHGVPV